MKKLVLFIHLLAFFFIFPIAAQSTDELLKEALASYQQGEKATNYQERKLAFNRALFLYHNLEEKDSYSGDLDQALGDTYAQLGENVWAVLYYQRALKKGSHNSLLSSHLMHAQEKLGLPSALNENQGTNRRSLFFLFSLNDDLLFGAIAITFLIFSCAIWFPFPWIRKLAIGSSVVLCLLLGDALFCYYSDPIEGIVVKATGIYRAPSLGESQLTNDPLLAGSKVQILQMTKDGNWLKIEEVGLIGYIPTDHVRSIYPETTSKFGF